MSPGATAPQSTAVATLSRASTALPRPIPDVHGQRLIATAEQWPKELVPVVQAQHIAPQQPAHPRGQIALGSFDHQVEVVAHQAIGMHLKTRFQARLRQGLEEIVPACACCTQSGRSASSGKCPPAGRLDLSRGTWLPDVRLGQCVARWQVEKSGSIITPMLWFDGASLRFSCRAGSRNGMICAMIRLKALRRGALNVFHFCLEDRTMASGG